MDRNAGVRAVAGIAAGAVAGAVAAPKVKYIF